MLRRAVSTPDAHPTAAAIRAAGLSRGRRLRATAPAIAQTAIAAALAWFAATELVGHPAPFFAPVSAIIALGIVVGQRARRAAELTLGVAVGVAVADALVILLGSGTLQIALVVAIAMLSAVALGGTRLVVGQAASSAVLVATIDVPTSFDVARPIDALVGGGVAVLVHYLLPIDPVRLARRHAGPLLDRFALALDEVAAALDRADHDAAVEALVAMRDLEGAVTAFGEATVSGVETARYSPLRRRERTVVKRYAIAAPEIDLAVRNARVLARGVVRAADLEAHIPPEAPGGVRDLAAAVRALRAALEDPALVVDARGTALQAAAGATLALERTSNLSVSVIIGQVRSIATDLLRALGTTQDAAADAIRQAAAGAAAAEAHR
ncbi:hypothetical protein C7Y72_11050 [Paraconexibacter algicola]|uniref:Integral membrane bound transporter domain-containing protein n=1 Tax=Paraconexibacter algicola TaxID=2133960 RepID=A0A2T4ULN4_9ACTN|nr:hypothetical protein C7Y72_11050 [Paraconexibacter algicola]